MDKLDRGVVAVRNGSGSFLVSWRFFATDPESICFNLYAKRPGFTTYTKLNTDPLTQTNFVPAAGMVNTAWQLYVTSIVNGVESSPSAVFTVPSNGFTTYRSGFIDIAFDPAKDGLALKDYYTKFCWPADLDGDGEYDYVVDRLSNSGASHKVQAYLRDGTLLWTIDMGPNVSICQGQDDMVIAYDMNGDGKSEVVIKSSDGTFFADGKGVNRCDVPYDTDNDGIIDYNVQSTRNSPQYITVLDGLTGKEMNSIEMEYPSNYTRTNKSIFMSDEYSNLNGHMSILYLDGKHPAVGFIYKTRTATDQYHWYAASAYGYNTAGQWVNWYNWERGYLDAAEAHSIRVADVDLDGHDELLDIGYGIKYDGTVAFNAHISHGDRFRTGDIDPDRPGLETFAIQQNAPNMLGQILYDAGTGVAIKKMYLSGVGDVGRGECMDVDSTRTGYEFWSTMPNIYDAQGIVLYEGPAPWPYEGIWWDGDLAREELASADGNGFNADIRKYDMSSHTFGTRLIEFAKMTNWQVKSQYGVRPAFFGDIAGDWREEVILTKKGSVMVDANTYETCTGIVGFSTDYPTTNRIYCLMQNPAYRMQATTRGYYQSAIPDFYLGFKMPIPPVAPVQEAKLTWKAGSTWDKTNAFFVLKDNISTSAFIDGDDVMFDISGDNSNAITLTTDVAPSKVWAMNPKGKDYVIGGNAKMTGNMEMVKSMNGNFTLNGNHTYTGQTTVSEGVLIVNGSLSSPVVVQAKGTLAGNVILNGGLTIRQSLNIEGGRLAPGNGLARTKLGKITVNGDFTLDGKTNLHFDILPNDTYKNDSLLINGNFNVNGFNNVFINSESGILPSGTYSLIKWTGSLVGSVNNFIIAGISGLPMSLVIENNTLKLVVNASRSSGNVVWTGSESGSWDFLSTNFKLSGNPVFFVNGDSVIFNDSAATKTITLLDNMTVAKVSFVNSASNYVLKGSAGISGNADLEKSGKGLLDIQNTANSYTGKTVLNNALVQVASLADAGSNSSFGANTSAAATNWTMNNSRLIVNATTTNTNRAMLLTGSDTLQVAKLNGVVTLSGLISGSGKLVKTGAGQLNLSGSIANTFSGGTVIAGGTLALGSLTMNTSGLGSGAIAFENAGKLIMYYNTADYNQKPVWNMTVASGQSGNLVASGRCIIGGVLNGAGEFNYTVPYVRADWMVNTSAFTGAFNVMTDGDGGTFRISANTNGLPLCTVNLANLVDMGAYATTGASSTSTSTLVRVGALSGVAGSSLSGGIWQIGNNNADATFSGTILAGATVTKIGSGNWTISGANTCTGIFTVSGGKLTVINMSRSATGSGPVIVNSGATLAGTGTVSGSVTINAGASLAPGTTAIGALTVGGNVWVNNNATILLRVNGTQNDKLIVNGTLALNGTLQIQNNGATFKNGDSFTIFGGGTRSGMFSIISPATPGEGLMWDTSFLQSDGVLNVKSVTSEMEELSASELKIYPNPVQGELRLSTSKPIYEATVSIYAINGKLLFKQSVVCRDNIFKINVSSLNAGIYLLRLQNNNQCIVQQFVKK